MLLNGRLEVLLHLCGLSRGEVFEELADRHLDALLAAVHHMLGQVAQEYEVMLLLVLAAEEVTDGGVVHVVQQYQQVVKDLDRVGLQSVDLSHAWILAMQRVLEIFV